MVGNLEKKFKGFSSVKKLVFIYWIGIANKSIKQPERMKKKGWLFLRKFNINLI
jgi:hypothetical protein